MYNMIYTAPNDYLMHHGVKGQKWGIRRYQNPDGSLTPEGLKRYGYDVGIKKGHLEMDSKGNYRLTEKGSKFYNKSKMLSGHNLGQKAAGTKMTAEDVDKYAKAMYSKKVSDTVGTALAVAGTAAVVATIAGIGNEHITNKKATNLMNSINEGTEFLNNESAKTYANYRKYANNPDMQKLTNSTWKDVQDSINLVRQQNISRMRAQEAYDTSKRAFLKAYGNKK